MATKRLGNTGATIDSLDDALSAQMPGWKVVPSSRGADAMSAEGGSEEAQMGVDLATLRKKFLGDASEAGDAADTVRRRAAAPEQSHVEVFKIEPVGGGPAQVAERRNGKIRIVSG